MENKHPHKNLDGWKKAMDLVEEIYKITSNFPQDERFGLISQLRWAAVSVPSNVAAGAGRRTDKEFMNFLSIAIGSLSELYTQVELSFRLKYIATEDHASLIALIDNCKAIIFGLRKRIMQRI